MNKYDLLIGFLIGLVATLTGTFLFLELFTEVGFNDGFLLMKQQGYLGKLITIGAILNLLVFFILLQKKKDAMAKGVILATVTLAILTIAL